MPKANGHAPVPDRLPHAQPTMPSSSQPAGSNESPVNSTPSPPFLSQHNVALPGEAPVEAGQQVLSAADSHAGSQAQALSSNVEAADVSGTASHAEAQSRRQPKTSRRRATGRSKNQHQVSDAAPSGSQAEAIPLKSTAASGYTASSVEAAQSPSDSKPHAAPTVAASNPEHLSHPGSQGQASMPAGQVSSFAQPQVGIETDEAATDRSIAADHIHTNGHMDPEDGSSSGPADSTAPSGPDWWLQLLQDSATAPPASPAPELALVHERQQPEIVPIIPSGSSSPAPVAAATEPASAAAAAAEAASEEAAAGEADGHAATRQAAAAEAQLDEQGTDNRSALGQSVSAAVEAAATAMPVLDSSKAVSDRRAPMVESAAVSDLATVALIPDPDAAQPFAVPDSVHPEIAAHADIAVTSTQPSLQSAAEPSKRRRREKHRPKTAQALIPDAAGGIATDPAAVEVAIAADAAPASQSQPHDLAAAAADIHEEPSQTSSVSEAESRLNQTDADTAKPQLEGFANGEVKNADGGDEVAAAALESKPVPHGLSGSSSVSKKKKKVLKLNFLGVATLLCACRAQP